MASPLIPNRYAVGYVDEVHGLDLLTPSRSVALATADVMARVAPGRRAQVIDTAGRHPGAVVYAHIYRPGTVDEAIAQVQAELRAPIFGPERDAEIAACRHETTDGRTYRPGAGQTPYTYCLDCQSYVTQERH